MAELVTPPPKNAVAHSTRSLYERALAMGWRLAQRDLFKITLGHDDTKAVLAFPAARVPFDAKQLNALRLKVEQMEKVLSNRVLMDNIHAAEDAERQARYAELTAPENLVTKISQMPLPTPKLAERMAELSLALEERPSTEAQLRERFSVDPMLTSSALNQLVIRGFAVVFDGQGKKSRKTRIHHHLKPYFASDDAEKKPMPGPADEQSAPDEEKIVVSTRSSLVKRGMAEKGGRVSDSHASVERTWSDGSIDFACAFDGCEYSNEKMRSVSNHYGSAHNVGNAMNHSAEPVRVDPSLSWEPNSNQRAVINRLAKEIAAAFAEGAKTPEEIAQHVTHSRSRDARFDSDVDPVARALTPEEQLAAIRRVLGTGLDHQLLQQAQEQLAQQERIAAMRRENQEEQDARLASLDEGITRLIAINETLKEQLAAKSREISKMKKDREALAALLAPPSDPEEEKAAVEEPKTSPAIVLSPLPDGMTPETVPLPSPHRKRRR